MDCQDMGRWGYHTYSEEELERTREELDGVKFFYCKYMYDEERLKTRGGRERILEYIEELEKQLEYGGYTYYEDAELRCCGQGD